MDQDVIICRCEEVLKSQILKALRDGARTVADVKRLTRAGMGLCQGSTCAGLVSQIIAQETGQDLGSILPFTHRPPVRPIKLDHRNE